MLVNTPSTIGHMVPRLTEFIELMAGKLMVNVHKDQIADKDIPVLLERLQDEVAEFRDEVSVRHPTHLTTSFQLKTPEDMPLNALEELADMGNFCFLLYQYLRDRGLKNVTERFIDEYYDIHPAQGKIYCKKSRSGSPLKPGDEVKGTMRRGRVYIRAQHAITGATVSLPRAHLVWWKRKGRWPIGTLAYRDPRPHQFIDGIYNLTEEAPKRDGRLPFVSQYRPKGREQSPNYGKWVYQRRHAFRLVRCGYYDTPEEAATKGLRDWKEKTRHA